MKKIKFLLIFLCLSITLSNAQIKDTEKDPNARDQVSIRISETWLNFLKEKNGGDNWTIKDPSVFLGRTESPYWTITSRVHQMDVDVNVQRRPGTILRCDLSNNNLTGALVDDKAIYTYVWFGIEKGIFDPRTNFYFSYNELTSVTANFMTGRMNEVVAFDHNKLIEFNPPYVHGDVTPSAYGAKYIYLNNNELSTYDEDWSTVSKRGIWWLNSGAFVLRMENNRYNFEEMKKVHEQVERRLNQTTQGLGGVSISYREPDFKFTYAPQMPQGSYSEESKDAGSTINLSFSLPDAGNQYVWELNGKIIPLSEGKSFSTSLTTATAGMYRCKVTNPALPELAIYSEPMMVFINKPSNQVVSDFNINNSKALGNSPQWSVIGEFNGTDPDGDQVYYRLVNHDGDNRNFRIIDGNTLVSSTTLFEHPFITEYEIDVEAFDIYGGKKIKKFTITKGESTGPVPTAVKLSSTKINENVIGEVGEFQLSGVTTSEFTFTLPDTKDNKFFEVAGTKLRTKIELNYEKQRYYTIRVVASKGDVSITKDFVVEAINKNDAPNGLILTTNEIETGNPAGTYIGLLVATDDDPADKNFTYEFDSELFVKRNDNQVLSKREFTTSDLGTKQLKVKVKDPHNASAEFTVNIVIKEPENPANGKIEITNSIIEENYVGKVATLSFSTRGDQVYELVSGVGADHNDKFDVVGNLLNIKTAVDFEIDKVLKIRLKAGTVETALVLTVANVNEAPTDLGLTNFYIGEKKPAKLIANILLEDIDGDLGLFELLESGDHSYFSINGKHLLLAKANDKASYTISIKGSDGEFAITQKFILKGTETIPVEVNHKPTAIGLTNFDLGTVEVNQSVADIVLEDVDGDAGQFELLESGDHSYFSINGKQLLLAKANDKASYTISIKGSDGEFAITQEFILKGKEIIPVAENHEPTAIGLTNFDIGTIAVNQSVADIVLEDVDGDAGRFELEESGDHSYFSINGRQLLLAKANDKASYTISIKGSDEEFAITQQFALKGKADDTPVVEQHDPTGIGLSNFILREDWPVGTDVAKVILEDEDAGLGAFTMGEGGDNDYFRIEGQVLKVNQELTDHDIQFTINITGTDGTSSVTRQFELYIINEDVGIDDVSITNSLLYPNPVENTLNIETGSVVQGDVTLAVYSLGGQLVWSKTYTNVVDGRIQNINLSQLKPGVYMVKMMADQKQMVKQIIKK
ncbi:MAG: T9SS type A sorting domain-containing protein [Carboxylicivirga sp.]|nr:T9SS type A sorting domain-containing protein [Carboxylicivirga sp.]